MKVVSFNANSIRTRQHQLEAIVERHNPIVIGVQETKVTDEDFPIEAIQSLGYECAFFGQKTHYGVALLWKDVNCLEVNKGFPGDTEEAQRRMIMGQFEWEGKKLNILNGYFPQGENREHPVKFPAKEKFYQDLKSYLENHCNPSDDVIVMGDYNVAPVDEDLGIGPQNVKRWLKDGKTSFLPEEREWLQAIADWGLVDTYRHLYPDTTDVYSWFDYRSRGFDREPRRGLRIDHIYATKTLIDRVKDSGSDYDVRAMERPSDHCPVWTEFQ